MSTYSKYLSRFEHGFFANISIGVMTQSCIGGIAAMAVLMNGNSLFQMIQLFIVVALSIGFNGSVLSQQTPKTIYNLLIVSVIGNTLIAIANFAAH